MGIVFIAALGLTGFYFYTLQKNTNNSANNQNLTVTQGTSETSWNNVQTKIAANCKATNSPVQATDPTFMQSLFKTIGVTLTYHPDTKTFSTDATINISGVAVSPGETCTVGWTGDPSGKGSVAYQDKSGKFQKLDVTGFPIPTPVPTGPTGTRFPVPTPARTQ